MKYLLAIIVLLTSINVFANLPYALRVVDYMDTKVLDTSSTNLSTTKYTRVVAKLAETCYELKVYDSTGKFVGVYTVDANSEASGVELQGIVGLGEDRNVNIVLKKGHSVYLKSESSTAITSGDFSIQCLGL